MYQRGARAGQVTATKRLRIIRWREGKISRIVVPNNPINPIYPPDRPNFPSTSSNPTPTGTTYSPNWDQSHPQYWPYQEKVLAWAYDSITLWDYSKDAWVQAFAFADGLVWLIVARIIQALGVGTNAFTPGVTQLPATTQIDWVRAWAPAS